MLKIFDVVLSLCIVLQVILEGIASILAIAVRDVESWGQGKTGGIITCFPSRFVDEMSLTNKEFSLY